MSENAIRNATIAYWRSLWPHTPRPKSFLPIRVIPSLGILFVSLYLSLYRHKVPTPAVAVRETLIVAAITARCHCGANIRTTTAWLEHLKSDVIPETVCARGQQA
jgi:hypothetical protein